MAFARLNMAIQYNMIVVDVKPPSAFTRMGSTKQWFTHRLVFRDKFGKEYNAQYITEESMQTYFTVGESTIFRVVAMDEKGCDQVAPVFDSKQTDEKILIPANAMSPAGTTYAMSLHHATQILMGERQGTFNPTSEDDIERMLKFADRINSWMFEKQSEIISDEVF